MSDALSRSVLLLRSGQLHESHWPTAQIRTLLIFLLVEEQNQRT